MAQGTRASGWANPGWFAQPQQTETGAWILAKSPEAGAAETAAPARPTSINPVSAKADAMLEQEDGVHAVVREAYGARVREEASAWGSGDREESTARKLGYTAKDLEVAGEGNLGEGCGNPLSFAGLEAGHVVVDLGSGAGFDCMLAGKAVGETGQVIGVDMTPDMITKARQIVKSKGIKNVSFRLGEIEYLPVGDNVADRVMSNCVINLSPDKMQVYREALRVLKPGGMLAISDVVATGDLPEHLKTAESLACWVSGAAKPDAVDAILRSVGFTDVTVELKPQSREVIKNWMPGSGAENFVVSADIRATKPGGGKKKGQNATTACATPPLPTPAFAAKQGAWSDAPAVAQECAPGAW